MNCHIYNQPNKLIYKDDLITKFLIESPKYGDFEIMIDTEDYDRIKNYRWHIQYVKHTNNFYVSSLIKKNNKWKNYQLHRLLLNLTDPELQIDHKFGKTLDNRKSELRICNHSENVRNQKIHKNNKSGFKGVSLYKLNNKWKAQINYNGKKIALGYYKTTNEAALAYNEAAKKYHGEFAMLNKI